MTMEENQMGKILNRDSYGLTWYEHAQPYLGSFRGMRYRIARNPMEDVALTPADKKGDAEFEIIIWPEPFCFEETQEDKKTTAYFPFTEEGKAQMIDWLNRQYEERMPEWEKVRGKY